MKWKDQIYVDGMLPFGQPPKYSMPWPMPIVAKEGVEHVFHYLDDFAVVGPPNSPECQRALDILKEVCAILGVPLAPDKQDGPITIITFLGILIDTIKQELRLPKEKLQRLLESGKTRKPVHAKNWNHY